MQSLQTAAVAIICHLSTASTLQSYPRPRALPYRSQQHKDPSTQFTNSGTSILFDPVPFLYLSRLLPLVTSHAVSTEMDESAQFRLMFHSLIFTCEVEIPCAAEEASTWSHSSTATQATDKQRYKPLCGKK